jgi:hypothetical protein
MMVGFACPAISRSISSAYPVIVLEVPMEIRIFALHRSSHSSEWSLATILPFGDAAVFPRMEGVVVEHFPN